MQQETRKKVYKERSRTKIRPSQFRLIHFDHESYIATTSKIKITTGDNGLKIEVM